MTRARSAEARWVFGRKRSRKLTCMMDNGYLYNDGWEIMTYTCMVRR